mgnify:FL=1
MFYVAWKGKNNYAPEIRAFVIGIVFSMLVFEYGAVNYTETATQIMLFFACTMLKEPRYERRHIDE